MRKEMWSHFKTTFENALKTPIESLHIMNVTMLIMTVVLVMMMTTVIMMMTIKLKEYGYLRGSGSHGQLEVGSRRAPRLVYILRECGRENKGLTRKQAQSFTCKQGKASQVKKKSNMDLN